MAGVKPDLRRYGSSFGTYGGSRLTDYKPPAEFNTERLNRNLITDVGEFSKTEEYIKDYIMTELGHPVVRVELTPFQIKKAIDRAATKFSYHAPLWTRQYAVFSTIAGCNLYEIPLFILHNLEYVVYKKTLLSIQAGAGTLEFDIFLNYFSNNFAFGNFEAGEFLLLQQNLEQLRKILSQEGSWDVIDGKYIQLYPIPVVTGDDVIMEFRGINSDTIQPEYLAWIQDYATALAKRNLGEIRSKYKTLPSPAGGSSLNGESLLKESIERIKELEDKLLNEISEPATFSTY